MKPKVRELREAVREYALRLPGAYEDHPWGESVAKVNKKVFVFFGRAADEKQIFAAKLPVSGDEVRTRNLGEPTGYGLGKSGWVTVTLTETLDVNECLRWVEESFRAVAPKKLIKELDQ